MVQPANLGTNNGRALITAKIRWILVAVGLAIAAVASLPFVPWVVARIGVASTPRITIYIQGPENLTGNEALSRSLENFDRVVASKLKTMTHSLFELLHAVPLNDSQGFSKIRLNGPAAQLATGAPVNHALFEWLPAGTNIQKSEPIFDVVRMGERVPKSEDRVYRVRFVGNTQSNENQAQSPFLPKTEDAGSGQIIIEVSSGKQDERDTCQINKKVSDIFPKDSHVVLEPIFEDVAACILSDYFRHAKEEEKARAPELFKPLFDRPERTDTARTTHAIQGIHEYGFFASQWSSRPSEADIALRKAIDHFRAAITVDRSPDSSSYPIIGYLYAHALTSAIIGPVGHRKSPKQEDYRGMLKEQIKPAFATAPFSTALSAKALAYDAISEAKSSVLAWEELVKSLADPAAPTDADDYKKEDYKTRMGVTIHRRIAARTRLMLAYRSLDEEQRAIEARDAVLQDILQIDKLASEDDKLTIDRELVKAAFDLDTAIDYLNIFLSATNEIETVLLAPSILTVMSPDKRATLKVKLDRNDVDFCSDDTKDDPDLGAYDPNTLEASAAVCKDDHAKCEEFRSQSRKHLKYVGRRFLGGALRKLERASEQIRSTRHQLCQGDGNTSECDDAPRGGKALGVRMSEQEKTARRRLLDDFEANVGIVNQLFTCYAPNFHTSACQSTAPSPAVPGSASAPPLASAAMSASATPQDESAASAPSSSSPGENPEKVRWQRWRERPNLGAQIVQMRAFCAIQQTAAKQDRGQSLANAMRYRALPEVWIDENPPSNEIVETVAQLMKDEIGLDAYRSQVPVLRALFAYSRLWQLAKPVVALLNAHEPAKPTDTHGKPCDVTDRTCKLLSIGREMLAPARKDEKASWLIVKDLGDALGRIRAEETITPQAKLQMQALAECQGPTLEALPQQCLLKEALDVYTSWANVHANKTIEEKDLLDLARARAQRSRREVDAALALAYVQVADDFFSWVRKSLDTQDVTSLELQMVRIAFFRVLLLEGAPVGFSPEIEGLALRVLRQMLAHEGDMMALEDFAYPNRAGSVASAFGFTRGKGDNAFIPIATTSDAERAISDMPPTPRSPFGLCSAPATLRQFLGYVRLHDDTYRASWLEDPSADAAMDLGQSVRRWGEIRGLYALSESIVLRSLIEGDQPPTTANNTSLQTRHRQRLAAFVGSDDFLKYMYARYLLNKAPEQAHDLVLGANHMEAKILRARALVKQGKAAAALVNAAEAARSYDALPENQRLTLDGAIYRTLGDAALLLGHSGGMPSGRNGSKDDSIAPLPEYVTAIGAYEKAKKRKDSEGTEESLDGLDHRLAIAYIESYADDKAVERATPNGADALFCDKGTYITALARWARGEHDVARALTSRERKITLFDLDRDSPDAYCNSDKPRVPLGWRTKWLRQELLRDRSRAPATSQ
jgi:hypothetical protein